MDRSIKQKIRKIVFTIIMIGIIVCPVLYVLGVVFEESYYKDIICVNVINLVEVQEYDGAEVFTDEWEKDQILLINTDSSQPEYKSLKANEVDWDKAYSGTALIEVTWKNNWYSVLSLDMEGCNGS